MPVSDKFIKQTCVNAFIIIRNLYRFILILISLCIINDKSLSKLKIDVDWKYNRLKVGILRSIISLSARVTAAKRIGDMSS